MLILYSNFGGPGSILSLLSFSFMRNQDLSYWLVFLKKLGEEFISVLQIGELIVLIIGCTPTWATKFGKKEAFPRGQIVGRQPTIPIAQNVSVAHERPIPWSVDDEAEGGVTGQVSVLDHGDFLQLGGPGRVVVGDGNYAHTSVKKGNNEAGVEVVPLGALPHPSGAVVLVDVCCWLGSLQAYQIADGDG